MSSIDDNYYIPPLSKYSSVFPDPRFASDEGLLAYGGDLSSHRLLIAYKKGIFPWYSKNDPILWWSPNPRLLLYPHKFKVRKSFKRVLKSGKFTVTFDRYFSEVITHCATVYREGQEASYWRSDQGTQRYLFRIQREECHAKDGSCSQEKTKQSTDGEAHSRQKLYDT